MESASRKVVKRSPARTVWLLNFPDLQETAIECESSLERDFVQVASVYSAVRSIRHQPFKFATTLGKYTPDFLIQFQDDSFAVVEVKPSQHLEKHAAKMRECVRQLPQDRAVFFVVDEKQIQVEGSAKQARLIRRYAKATFPEAESARALAVVQMCPSGISLAKLCHEHGFLKPVLLNLLARRQACCAAALSADDSALIVPVSMTSRCKTHATDFAIWLGTEPWQASV